MGFLRVNQALLRVTVALGLGLPAVTPGQQPIAPWRLTEVARVGSINNPDDALTAVGQVLLGTGDRLLVAQPAESVLRVFDQRGRFIRRIGRNGRGPGEFDQLASIGLRGDTLYASDGSRHVSFFSQDGLFLSRLLWSSPGVRTDAIVYIPTAPQVLRADRSGLVKPHVAVRVIPGRPPSAQPVPVPIFHLDRHGAIRDTTIWIARQPGMFMMGGGTRMNAALNPFDDQALHVLALDGSGVLIVERSAPVRSARATFTVRKVSPNGDTMISRVFPYTPVQLGQADVAAAVRDVQSQFGSRPAQVSAGRVSSPEAIESGLRAGRHIPNAQLPVTAAVPTQDARLWLKRERTTAGSAHWDVLDASLTVRGRVLLPYGEQVIAARDTMLVTLSHDELDVPLLRLYRLGR